MDPKEPWHFLTHFENSGYVHIWQDDNKHIQKIEFPRFGAAGSPLTLEAKRKEGVIKFCYTAQPSYSLAKRQHIDYLRHFQDFLVLQKDDDPNKQLVLIPKHPLAKKEKALSSKIELDKEADISDRQEMLRFSYNPETGKLEPVSIDGWLMLIQILLGQQRYKEDIHLLRQRIVGGVKLNKKQREIVRWIVESKERTKDSDPRAIAIRPLAYHVLRHQDPQNKFKDLSDETLKLAEKDRHAYPLIEQHLGTYTLTNQQKPLAVVSNILEFEYPFRRGLKHCLSHLSQKNDKKFDKNELVLSEFSNRLWIQWAEDYRTAKEGTHAEREALIQKCHLKNPSYRSAGWIQFLIMVAKHPKRFPEVSAVAEQVENYRNAQSMKDWNKRRKAMQPAEDFFDSMEERLRILLQQSSPLFDYWEHAKVDLSQSLKTALPEIESVTAPSPAMKNWSSMKVEEVQPLALPENWIVEEEISHEKIQKRKAAQEHLHGVFHDVKHSDERGVQECARLGVDTDAYFNRLSKKRFLFQENHLGELLNRLPTDRLTLRKDIRKDRQAIEKLLNKLPKDLRAQLIRKGQVQGDLRQRLTIDDAIFLYVSQDSDPYFEWNNALSSKDIANLKKRTCTYLQKSTDLHRIQRTHSQARALAKAIKNNQPTDQLRQTLAETIKSKREFNVRDNEDKLVLEYYQHILLYRIQNEKINALNDPLGQGKTGQVIELRMGLGKTDVIALLEACKAANGKQLSMVVTPKPLFPTVVKQFASFSSSVFRKKTTTLDLDDVEEITPDLLKQILTTLTDAKDNKKVLHMHDETFKKISLFHQKALISGMDLETRGMWNQVNRMIREGELFIDEVDRITHRRHQTIMTIGEKHPLDLYRQELMLSTFHMLEVNGKKWGLDTFHNNKNRKPFSKKHYEQIKGNIAESWLNNYQNDVYAPANLKRYLKKIDAPTKQILLDYIQGKDSSPSPEEFVANIANQEIRDSLAVWYYQLNVLIPLTLGKEYREHYGSSKDPSVWVSEPYLRGKATGDRHGSLDEEGHYSIQKTLIEGFTVKQIKEEIRLLRKQASEERKIGNKLLAETRAYQQFLMLCGDLKLSLLDLQEEDYSKLVESIRGNLDATLTVIGDIILPRITLYPERLIAGAGTFTRSKIVHGVTGTAGHCQDSFPKSWEVTTSIGTDGETIGLTQMKTGGVIHEYHNTTNIDELLPQLFMKDGQFRKINAWIDEGGWGKVMDSNQSIAQAILRASANKTDPPIKGVMYWDETGNEMFLARGDNTPVPFREGPHTIPPGERFTYYDKDHCTGADVKQGDNCNAVMTTNHLTTGRDVRQGEWRLRGFAKGQTIEIWYPDDSRNAIQEALEITESTTPLTLDDLNRFWAINEEGLALLAVRQDLFNIVQEEVITKIFSNDTVLDIQEEAMKKLKSLIVHTVSDSPFAQFGRKKHPQNIMDVMQQEIDRILTKEIKSYLQSPKIKQLGINLKKLTKRMWDQVDTKVLPSQVMTGPQNLGQNISVQVQQEVQQEVEQEVQQKISEAKPAHQKVQKWNEKINFFDEAYLTTEKSDAGVGITHFHEFLATAYGEPWLKDCLGDNLLASENHLPNISGTKPAYKPLGAYCKSMDEYLARVDAKGNLKLLLLHHQDAQFFKQQLIKDRDNKPNIKRDCKVALINARGVIQSGSEPLSADDLKKCRRPLMLIKVLKGGIASLNEQELQEFKDWLEELTPENRTKLYHFLMNEVLPSHGNLKTFPLTAAYGIFETCGVNVGTAVVA